jgi:hypothetical protein
MTPAIRDGDLLTVEPVTAPQVRRGDVVLYLSPRGLTAHRVVGLGPSVLRCRGEAAGSEEELVPAELVLGKVEDIEHTTLVGPAARFGARGLVRHLPARIRVFLRWFRAGNGRN